MGAYFSRASTAEATKLIFQNQQDLTSHITRILSIRPTHDLPPEDIALFKSHTEAPYAIITESTIFHPQGGGQPSDTGSIRCGSTIFNVSAVRKTDAGVVLHVGTFDGPATMQTAGEVVQEINGERRALNSKYHTAGHILSHAVQQVTGATLAKAYLVPGEASVTFKERLGEEVREQIQEVLDEIVRSDILVEGYWLDGGEAKRRVTAGWERYTVSDGEQVRVVEVKGLDMQVCGGTHVRRTKELGRIIVRKLARKNGLSVVGFEVVSSLGGISSGEGKVVRGGAKKLEIQEQTLTEPGVDNKVALRKAKKLEKQEKKRKKMIESL